MNGIMTIAFGQEYDKIAAATILYCVEHCADIPPFCVVTNLPEEDRSELWKRVLHIHDVDFIYFDGAKTEDNRKYKMNLWDLSPYEKTIYIDADAVIQKDGIGCIYSMLDNADFVLNGPYVWRVGDKIPRLYAKAMLLCRTLLPITAYNGGFFAWKKCEAAERVFVTWHKYWDITGQGRDMPALACAVKKEKPLIFDVALSPVFAPSSKNENAIIQHNYNDTFFDDFNLPRYQESKPFDTDPTDFMQVELKQNIVIKSFNGIGDMLFATPAFEVIKKTYPDCKLIVNTNHPSLLKNNPYIDEVGTKNEGVFLKYTAPDSGRLPTEHHIIEDWRIICNEYHLITETPDIRPQLYITDLPAKRDLIGVQVMHKRLYHGKRVWQGYEELAQKEGFEAIPNVNRLGIVSTEDDKDIGLVKQIASYKAVVCNEGGISHIAAALKVPAVVLFGGFTDPLWTGYPDHVNITSDIDCKHCYNNKPCERDFECWKAISVDYVEETARKLTGKDV